MQPDSLALLDSGKHISYKWIGDRSKPVILFANGAVFNYYQFDAVYLPKLQNMVGNDFSFLLYDYVGYGLSSPLEGKFDFEKMADQQVQLMDKLEIEKAHLFGLSKGSLVSHLVAADYPDRVHSLAAYGSPNPANEDARQEIKAYYRRRKQELQVLRHKFDHRITEDNFNEVYEEIYIPSMMERKKDELNLFQKLSVWFMKPRLKPLILGPEIGMMDKLFNYFLIDIDEDVKLEYIERMKTIDLPTLHMHGKQDPYIPHSSSVLLSEWVPSSKLKIFKRYMHNKPTLISWQGSKIMSYYSYFLNNYL